MATDWHQALEELPSWCLDALAVVGLLLSLFLLFVSAKWPQCTTLGLSFLVGFALGVAGLQVLLDYQSEKSLELDKEVWLSVALLSGLLVVFLVKQVSALFSLVLLVALLGGTYVQLEQGGLGFEQHKRWFVTILSMVLVVGMVVVNRCFEFSLKYITLTWGAMLHFLGLCRLLDVSPYTFPWSMQDDRTIVWIPFVSSLVFFVLGFCVQVELLSKLLGCCRQTKSQQELTEPLLSI